MACLIFVDERSVWVDDEREKEKEKEGEGQHEELVGGIERAVRVARVRARARSELFLRRSCGERGERFRDGRRRPGG